MQMLKAENDACYEHTVADEVLNGLKRRIKNMSAMYVQSIVRLSSHISIRTRASGFTMRSFYILKEQ